MDITRIREKQAKKQWTLNAIALSMSQTISMILDNSHTDGVIETTIETIELVADKLEEQKYFME